MPPNPGAWLTQAARHNALDRLRREKRYRDKLALLAEPDGRCAGARPDDADERLPLLFGCCHPALSPDAQLALTLRAVCGLTTAQIARATLTPESTVAQRIVRAKRKIGATGIPLRIPEGAERAERLDIVLTVVSVMYSEAHLVAGGDAAADRDLADDALWLARVVARRASARGGGAGAARAAAVPPRARGRARGRRRARAARRAGPRRDGIAALLAEAQRALERAAMLRRPGRWQLHAAIAACHADARDGRRHRLAAGADALRHAAARTTGRPSCGSTARWRSAEVEGPQAALAEVDALAERAGGLPPLARGARAACSAGSGATTRRIAADLRALELTANEAERRLLAARVGR